MQLNKHAIYDVFRPENRWFWLGLFFINLFLRLATLYTPFFDVDESQFAGFAHVLLDGGLPFRDSLDTKPLGIYLFYAGVFALFGRFSMFGVHLVTTLWIFLAAFWLARLLKHFGYALAGRWAALFLVVFSTTYVPKYVATSINAVMIGFLIASALCHALAEKRVEQKRTPLGWDAVAGLVLGLGFLFKYQAGIQTVLFCVFTLPLWGFRRARAETWGLWFRRNATVALTFVLPFALHSLVLWQLGVWQDFYEWSVLGSGRYIAGGNQTISFWQSFLTRFGAYVLATSLLWELLWYGWRQRAEARSPLLIFLGLWFVLSLIPVSMSGRFYAHYFLQLLPALCGLAGVFAVHRLTTQAEPLKVRKLLVTGMLVPALFFWAVRADYRTFLKLFPDDGLYEQQSIGLALRKIAEPGDRLFVWGFATAIYFYSELKPSSRYLWSDWLTGRIPGPPTGREAGGEAQVYVSESAWNKFWEDMRCRPPRFFVDTSPADMHGYAQYPVARYPELARFLKERYQLVNTVENVAIYELVETSSTQNK